MHLNEKKIIKIIKYSWSKNGTIALTDYLDGYWNLLYGNPIPAGSGYKTHKDGSPSF